MVLTAAQAIAHIDHALFDARSDIAPMQVVNTAGKLLYQMRQWNFRQRGPATLGFTSGQAYVELPANFGSMVDITTTDGLTVGFRLVTISDLLQLRTESIGNPRQFWGAVTWENPSGGTRVAPRMELYPTPSTTEANALTFFYRSRWVDVTDDGATLASVPELAEPLYLRMVRQVAKSYEDEDSANPIAALNAIQSSLEYHAALREDSGTQKSYGVMRNGVAGRRQKGSFWYDLDVSAPS